MALISNNFLKDQTTHTRVCRSWETKGDSIKLHIKHPLVRCLTVNESLFSEGARATNHGRSGPRILLHARHGSTYLYRVHTYHIALAPSRGSEWQTQTDSEGSSLRWGRGQRLSLLCFHGPVPLGANHLDRGTRLRKIRVTNPVTPPHRALTRIIMLLPAYSFNKLAYRDSRAKDRQK